MSSLLKKWKLKMNEVRPNIVISKCLGIDSCRFNGQRIRFPLLESLKNKMNLIPVCPEVEIGLGIPRNAVRLLRKKGQTFIVNSKNGKDLTEKMNNFIGMFFSKIKKKNIDGFILKSSSPTCGIKSVKVYNKTGKASAISKDGRGVFGKAIINKFKNRCVAVEDDGRLRNFEIREHFFTKLYTFKRFKNNVGKNLNINNLIKFHTYNKYLLMCYNQENLKKMGQIVANNSLENIDKKVKKYKKLLISSFETRPRYTSNINVLLHTFGYFSEKINTEEKAFFLDNLEKYRNNKIPLSVLLKILQSWTIRFEEDYLKKQSFFKPYPEALIDITDSGKGRNY